MNRFATLCAFGLVIGCAGFLGGCAHHPEVVVTKERFVPVVVNSEYLVEDKCPWPLSKDFIRTGNDVEVSDYLHAAYSAWSCEHMTRMEIGKQNSQQQKDIEARNAR